MSYIGTSVLVDAGVADCQCRVAARSIDEVEAHEKSTLQLGACIVLSTVALGQQFGHWPMWSAALALAGYLAWIVAYSEATVQTLKRRYRFGLCLAETPAAPRHEKQAA